MEKEVLDNFIHPSKGNQAKYRDIDGYWHKLDYLGFESASEYAVSELLKQSNVTRFVAYELEKVPYHTIEKTACKSKDFTQNGVHTIVYVEEIVNKVFHKSWAELFKNKSTKERMELMVDTISQYTHLDYFGEYLTTLLELDALTLNEDRHTRNIAVLMNPDGTFDYAPVFDNGAAFLSDTSLDYPFEDYPFETPIKTCIQMVKAKPFSTDFKKQVRIARELYGSQLQFERDADLSKEVLHKIEVAYNTQIMLRIKFSLMNQKTNYPELFQGINKDLIWEQPHSDPFQLSRD